MPTAAFNSSRGPRRALLSAALLASITGLVVACAADGGMDIESAGSPVEPSPTSAPTGTVSLPPPSQDGDDDEEPVRDGGKTDAGKDAGKDSGVDAGPVGPVAGTACTNDGEVQSRPCGACGKQETVCLDAGGGLKWTEYGVCQGELAGGCIAGTVETEACGKCGTRTRTCTQYCAWTTTACGGEPTNACTPGLQDYTSAGCPSGGVRQRACGETCGFSSYSSCAPLRFELTAPTTVGATSSAVFPLRLTQAMKRQTGTCPAGTFSTTTNHAYVYVEIKNPTTSTITLSAWNTEAFAGSPILDTLMGWYNGTTIPADEAARRLCAKGMVDPCPTGLPCGNSKWAGLTAANSVVVPPSGTVLLYFASYTAGAEGDVKLVVRADTIN